MQRAFAAALLTLALGVGSGCSSAPRPPTTLPPPRLAAGNPGAPPAWIPPYSPQQLALLAPVDQAIQVPAARVFPDLRRFWYASNRTLSSPEEALKFSHMVATILTESPRFYTLGEASADLANLVVQYGPPGAVEPDGFQIARRAEGNAIGELTPASGASAARTAHGKGQALAQKGDFEGAAAVYRDAITTTPSVPALRIALADALLRLGKPAEAEAAYRATLGVDPTFATAHLGLATLAEKRGDLNAAKRALAEALAYQPNSRPALDLAVRMGGGDSRIEPFAIFLDVDGVGAIRVGAAGSGPAQMYGGCRAVMRYEPEVRAQIFEEPPETPYYLSLVEEVICLEAALGAYIVDQSDEDEGEKKPDPKLDALLELARKEGLAGYIMFEILGKHRPERARLAPPEVHRAVVRYIELHVLGQKEAPDGIYNASRGQRGREAVAAATPFPRAPGRAHP